MSDQSTPLVTVAKQAEAAARRCVATGERQANPHDAGTEQAREWQRRYEIALLRLSAPEGADGSA